MSELLFFVGGFNLGAVFVFGMMKNTMFQQENEIAALKERLIKAVDSDFDDFSDDN